MGIVPRPMLTTLIEMDRDGHRLLHNLYIGMFVFICFNSLVSRPAFGLCCQRSARRL